MTNRSILLFFIFILSTFRLESQELFKKGFRIDGYGIHNGACIVPPYYYYTKRLYILSNDTCINNSTYFQLDIYDSLLPIPKKQNRIKQFIRIDSVNKKIYRCRNLYSGGLTGSVLYDFNLEVGDTNDYGYVVTQIKFENVLGKLRRIFYFLKNVNSKMKYDIWVENFGSIVLDYIHPSETSELSIDTTTYSYSDYYNPKINFGNQYSLSRTIIQSPNILFKEIKNIFECDLPYTYLSYNCDSTIDTVVFYNKCITDTNFAFSAELEVDTSIDYRCLDSIHYRVSITPNSSNKKVVWTYRMDTFINYPVLLDTPLYYNLVIVRNSDGSCSDTLISPKIRPDCGYCDNPSHKPNLSLSLKKDSLYCTESPEIIIESSKGRDSLWAIFAPYIIKKDSLHTLQCRYGNRHCVQKDTSLLLYIKCSSLHILNNIKDGITVYPTLSSHTLSILLPRSTSSDIRFEFIVYSIDGRILIQEISCNRDNTNFVSLDISDLDDGDYLLKVTDSLDIFAMFKFRKLSFE